MKKLTLFFVLICAECVVMGINSYNESALQIAAVRKYLDHRIIRIELPIELSDVCCDGKVVLKSHTSDLEKIHCMCVTSGTVSVRIMHEDFENLDLSKAKIERIENGYCFVKVPVRKR